MATARRLPSGSYRIRVFSHMENGKKVNARFEALLHAIRHIDRHDFEKDDVQRIEHETHI